MGHVMRASGIRNFRADRHGNSAPLWVFLSNVESAPRAWGAVQAIQLGIVAVAHGPIKWAALEGIIVILCSWAGVSQFRKDPHSLRRVFRMFQLNGWGLAVTLAGLMWWVSYLSGNNKVYGEHLPLLSLLYLVSVAVYTACYLTFWRNLRDLYRSLAAYRSAGCIDAADLFAIITFRGKSLYWLRRTPIIVSVSVPLGMVLSRALGRTGADYFWFVASTLIVSPYIVAIMLSRLWLQYHYLGRDDLRIIQE